MAYYLGRLPKKGARAHWKDANSAMQFDGALGFQKNLYIPQNFPAHFRKIRTFYFLKRTIVPIAKTTLAR